MPDDGNRNLYDELALLRTELARQQQTMASLRRTKPRPTWRSPIRRLGAALTAALLLALVPLALLAAGPFTDLDPNSPHNANIAAIQAVGITKGCDPPDFTQYCPKDFVTREEMASFLARTAGLGGNPPVVNAKTATNATNATNAQYAETATNAQQLGGQPPNAYLHAGDITMRFTFMGLVTDTLAITIDQEGVQTVVERSGTGTGTVYLPLDVPVSVGFTTYRIKSATICYNTPMMSSTRITATRIRALAESGSYVELYADSTTRPATPGYPNFVCYTVEDPSPNLISGASYLSLSLNFPDLNEDIMLGQVKVVLTP